MLFQDSTIQVNKLTIVPVHWGVSRNAEQDDIFCFFIENFFANWMDIVAEWTRENGTTQSLIQSGQMEYKDYTIISQWKNRTSLLHNSRENDGRINNLSLSPFCFFVSSPSQTANVRPFFCKDG